MSPRLILLRLLSLGAGVVLLTACSSSEQGTTTMATPEPTRSTAQSTSPAASAPAAPATPPAPATSAGAATAQGATITIKDFDYAVPASVAAGAQVQVVNNDGEAHTVTIPGGPSIVVPPRGSTVTFSAPAKAGTYEIVCEFHGNMTAQLVVT